MHEMAITENILQIVLAEAKKAGAGRVSKISLVIGELSAIEDASVQLYFEMLSDDTMAAGARLEFTHMAATLRCNACEHCYPKQGHSFICPRCGSDGMLTGDAKEFYVESIEVECADG